MPKSHKRSSHATEKKSSKRSKVEQEQPVGDDYDPEEEFDRLIMNKAKTLLGLTSKSDEDKLLAEEGLDFLFKGVTAAGEAEASDSDDGFDEEFPDFDAANGDSDGDSDSDENQSAKEEESDEDDEDDDDMSSVESSAADSDTESTDQESGSADETSTSNAEAVRPTSKVLAAPAGINERLVKNIRGLVNRLAEGTLENIAKSIAALFESNSRNEICETLTNEALNATCRVARNSYSGLYTALVVLVSYLCETDLTARFLETTVDRFRAAWAKLPEQADDCRNMLMVLSYLYLFDIVHHELLFDVLRLLTERFTESDVELILLTVQTVGTPLRKADPMMLKELVDSVQSKASKTDATNLRFKFMLEALVDLKNSKRKFEIDTLQLSAQKLAIVTARKQAGQSKQPLQITWQDLLTAETTGRWWRTGHAWAGRDKRPQEAASAVATTGDDVVSKQALLLRMTTPVRKSIFTAVMGSEDYVNAFERVMKLGLKKEQAREVIYVLVDCCAQEKTFNPFYVLVAQKLCAFNHGYSFTLQLRFWDIFKELQTSEYAVRKMKNLACFLSKAISLFALSLSMLKAIPWDSPHPRQVMFLRMFFVSLLTENSQDTVRDLFGRLSGRETDLLRDSLMIFLKQYMKVKASFPIPLTDEKRELLRQRVKFANNALEGRMV
eukprot:TRINITY_DN767_c0_g1_i1.p1 TRINITY_DN767_c0_g1~~TRINITY_DN767_c0_g1_i1.p1  ORF type:complete len:683 (+),score=180.06 TRINITY_DN767_c0_g1_i1:45-2051(+)